MEGNNNTPVEVPQELIDQSNEVVPPIWTGLRLS